MKQENGNHNQKADISKSLSKEEYQQYIKKVTPSHNLGLQMLKAFITGGSICLLGQILINFCQYLGLGEKEASSWSSIVLIFIAVLLTGLNVFPQIAKWGGAGALVPITGFANSIAAEAVEFQKEGQVFGIGCKIFTIAGPVILYGVFSSWILGIFYWVFQQLEIWNLL